MSDSFTPNPLFAFGRVDTSAGEGGESLHKVNPNLFGVDTDGHIGRGSEVDGEATPEDVSIEVSPIGNVPEPPEGTVVEPTFAPEGGTVDTGPGALPVEDQVEAPAEPEAPVDPEITVEPEAPADNAPVEDQPDAPVEPEAPADPGAETPAPAPADEVDYESMLKAQLVALAESRGIDSSGTKADIIERLRIADAG